ncbi:hypothetical protein [Streptodolium elevatio]|uniref:Uncharacterized protein n=1 Tax=Streptodolium elevatio TaxID=3157996 RepID=A0ABV3DBE2_9ACTN
MDDGSTDYMAPLLTLVNYVAWIVLCLCFVGLLICAARLAMSYRSGDPGNEVVGLLWVMAACVLVGSAGGIVSALR